MGQRLCRSAEEFKAWSQNFGHEDVDTTFRSYGEVPGRRQAEIIRYLAEPAEDRNVVLEDLIKTVERLRRS